MVTYTEHVLYIYCAACKIHMYATQEFSHSLSYPLFCPPFVYPLLSLSLYSPSSLPPLSSLPPSLPSPSPHPPFPSYPLDLLPNQLSLIIQNKVGKKVQNWFHHMRESTKNYHRSLTQS